jgi:hypothetical protein
VRARCSGQPLGWLALSGKVSATVRSRFDRQSSRQTSAAARGRKGTLLYERTLGQGQTVRFSGHRLWIRVGAPWNLDTTLDGKPVQLPATVGNVIAIPSGLENG